MYTLLAHNITGALLLMGCVNLEHLHYWKNVFRFQDTAGLNLSLLIYFIWNTVSRFHGFLYFCFLRLLVVPIMS